MKRRENEKNLLSEDWDTDASASDNESYEIEMMQDESIKASPKKNSPENK